MTDACYCDYDAPLVYEARLVKARKSHKCDECGHQIQPGEQYERASGLDSEQRRWYHADTCARCLDLREYMTRNVPCFCWAHGALLQDARDAAEHYHEPGNGLWFGYGRRMIAINRHKRG